MAEPITIDVWQGDIAELEVDAIILPATESLFMTSGVAASVKRHGGEEIERAAVAQGPQPVGRAVVTHAGALAAGYVIHAVDVGHDRRADAARLTEAIDSALAFVEPLQLRRIACSLLGAEFGVLPPDEAATILVTSLTRTAAPLESVVIVTTRASESLAARQALDLARTRTS